MTLYDPGLQPERTELAWRRTALAIAVGSLAGMRVLPMLLGSPLWIIAGVIGLSVAAILWRAARSRYHAVYNALHPVEDTAALPDGRLLVFCALFTAAVGMIALFTVMVTAAAR